MYDQVRHGTHHKAKLETCPRNHKLEAPNLRSEVARLGRRGCLACGRATTKASYERSRGRDGSPAYIDALADRYYDEIMSR